MHMKKSRKRVAFGRVQHRGDAGVLAWFSRRERLRPEFTHRLPDCRRVRRRENHSCYGQTLRTNIADPTGPARRRCIRGPGGFRYIPFDLLLLIGPLKAIANTPSSKL
jgi:hypothetical protein